MTCVRLPASGSCAHHSQVEEVLGFCVSGADFSLCEMLRVERKKSPAEPLLTYSEENEAIHMNFFK